MIHSLRASTAPGQSCAENWSIVFSNLMAISQGTDAVDFLELSMRLRQRDCCVAFAQPAHSAYVQDYCSRAAIHADVITLAVW